MELLRQLGSIEDYTYVWWDVRPHPRLGTVETRIFDQQTRIEHTEGLAALMQSLCRQLCQSQGDPPEESPHELVDDLKIRAALRGMNGTLVDFDQMKPAAPVDMTRRLLHDVAESAAELGCDAELANVEDILENGTGAQRQLAMFERRPDLDELMREVVERTRP
jgi:carboxylate-amine ligase